MKVSASPLASWNPPSGIYTWPLRSTAQTSTGPASSLPSSRRQRPSSLLPWGMRIRTISAWPPAKLVTLSAVGRQSSRAMASAASRSGLITIARPSFSFR